MSSVTSNTSTGGPCTPAAPPSRSEVERKLSFRSAASPRIDQSPRKKRSPSTVSGNDSDTSLSSAQGQSSVPLASPILSPSLTLGASPGTSIQTPSLANRQLSAIAERLRGNESVVEETEEYEEQDEGEDVSDEEDQGEVEQKGQGELERGMEGERVLRAGYLYKKQEKRKVWKKKWFVLRTGKLAYYKDDREYSLSRVMDLRIIHTAAPVKVKKHSFTFGIVTKKRTFLVEASSQSEMDEWVSAISNARRKLTEAGPTPGSRQVSEGAPAPPPGPGLNDGYASSATGTSPVVNTSFLNRAAGTSGPSSPSQHYSSSSPTYASPSSDKPQPGLISQMARMNVASGPTQSQPVGVIRSPSIPTAPGQPIRSYSTRREPSASSVSSAGADYFPRTPSANHSPHPPVPVGHGVSSDSDDLDGGEGDMYFSDIASRSQLGTSVGTTKTALSVTTGSVGGSGFGQASGGGGGQVDPARVILSAYLMKRSKGRGRKVWRKRWFYLTSQGLTYTKSHMDTKPLRNIPLSSILDAIDQSSALDDIDPSSSDSDTPARPSRSPSISKFPGPPQRQPSSSGAAFGSNFGGAQPKEDEHTFRLVTAKRNYVLCAPSEEDEIKWLAAVKALLNRERGVTSPVSETPPRLMGLGPGLGVGQNQGAGGVGVGIGNQGWAQVPTITQQPPTPGSTTGTTPQSQGQTQVAPSGIGLRGRSATYLAKSAVADVERRYHPEQQQQQA